MAIRKGGNGVDTLRGTAGVDTLLGFGGHDLLTGSGSNDRLDGGSGNDSLDGGAGGDSMLGGSGNDTYVVDSAGDRCVEAAGAGIDTVKAARSYTLPANLEKLILTGAAALNGTGNTLANTLTGNAAANTLLGSSGNDRLLGGAGNDRLDGGVGTDRMEGGTGNDLYVVDAAGETLIETSGVDRVASAVTFTLATGFEHLTLTGSAAIRGTGNAAGNTIAGNGAGNTLMGMGGNDRLLGNAGNDRLDGGTGADRLEGGAGNDTYVVDNPGDVVLDTSGTDTVQAAISYVLPGTVERLVLTGAAALDGSGNALANTITGNAAANSLAGLDGADRLLGGGGDDSLDGGDGDDRLEGGADNDSLVGGDGLDRAVHAGAFAGYAISLDGGTLTVADLAPGDGGEGTDLLSGVELLQFADVTVSLHGSITLDTVAAGQDGALLPGVEAGDAAGTTLAVAGDVNGDGLADILVGAPGQGDGVVHVVLGGGALPAALGDGGFTIAAEAAGDGVGSAVAGAGDLDADGIGDIAVGASGRDGGAGTVYVVFGHDGPPADVSLADIGAGTGGFRIAGEGVGDAAGSALAGAGDLDGDGIGDLAIGAPGHGGGAGAVYVVLGRDSGFADVDLADVAAGAGGLRIVGEAAGDAAGTAVAAAGDVNGDGLADLLIGAPGHAGGAGAAYVVFGVEGGLAGIDLAAVAQGQGGFKVQGAAAEDGLGGAIAGAGDVNGDGFADLLLGAPGHDAGGFGAGAAYVIFGGAASPGTVDLAALGAAQGFRMVGERAGDALGTAVAGLGDRDGDGLDDLLLGAPGSDAGGQNAGGAYVVLGLAANLAQAATLDLGLVAAGVGGFAVLGDANGSATGATVAADAGRILLGAPGHDAAGTDAGALYVLDAPAAAALAPTAQNLLGSYTAHTEAEPGVPAVPDQAIQV